MTDQHGDDDKPGGVEIVDIGELIPPDWHGQRTWISSYRAYGLQQAELGATEPFELLGVRVQLFWGGAPYLEIKASMEPQIDGSVVVHRARNRDRRHSVRRFAALTLVVDHEPQFWKVSQHLRGS